MESLKTYYGSQDSSNDDENETNFVQNNAAPSTSYSNDIAIPNNQVDNFQPIERIPIDRLMVATAYLANTQKPVNQKQKRRQAATSFFLWLLDVEKELHSCLGSMHALQKPKILETMDKFISKLTQDYDKMMKPSAAGTVAQYIRTYLHIYKYLFRELEKGKRYYKRIIKILAIYTDLELCASLRPNYEFDCKIAERIVLIYQTHLDNSDNSMVLEVLLNTKRLWRQHKEILVLLFEYFLVRKTPIELPDTLFMKNLILFKKWLYIEVVPEERRKARDAFVKYIKPKKATICNNSLFKPYLPVDEEGFATADNSHDILDKEYAHGPLIHCLRRKSVSRLEEHPKNVPPEEIIVLTDDDDDDADDDDDEDDPDEFFTNSYGESSSQSFLNYDEVDTDDWYSESSQGNQSSYSQNMTTNNNIETVVVDSPACNNSETLSLSSLDTIHSPATFQSDECAQHAIEMHEDIELPSKSNDVANEVNGENAQDLPTLNESIFIRLVNDINSTHLSIPGNTSTESKVTENGQTSQTAESNDYLNGESAPIDEIEKSDKLPNGIEQANGIIPHLFEPAACSTNGDSSMTTLSDDHNMVTVDEMSSTVQYNHEEAGTVKNCDNNVNIISSAEPLKNHEETLTNINEIVEDDLLNDENAKPSEECSTSNYVQINADPSPSGVDTASSPIAELPEVEIEIESASNNQHEHEEIVQENLSQDWIPAAESTASVVNETSLLSKSEQEILYKDRDALIMADLWNGSIGVESPKPEENKSPRTSDDSPVAFFQNSLDPSRLKTYARRSHRRTFVETKTISTQTSECSSPVTTIEDNNIAKMDKHLLTDKEEEDFLRDIYTTDITSRASGSPRIRSPVYLSSTPVASTPIGSTSNATPNLSGNVLPIVNTSEIGSAEVVVKRKRGRPRKYPLPDAGATPVPKPVKSPRKPRPPRQPKPPREPSDEVVVFEKRVLRERKPKPPPTPPPPPVVKKPRKTVSPAKPKQSRRRNTIKMTIDAIFNTQSPQVRASMAVQARRISQILGIPINAPQLATILKRRSYNKTINNISKSMNSDSSLNDSSMLQTFRNRTNGQLDNTTNETTSQPNTSSTILARKTYIKPNITISSFSSFSSALRRLSFSSRRISFSSSMRHNRTNNSRKSQSQRYAKIDIYDTSKKRGRKKGTKDSVPRKRPTKKRTAESAQNSTADTSNVVTMPTKPITEVGDRVNETVELVDLTNEMTPFELDTSGEMRNQFENIQTALSSTTQHIHNDSDALATKRRKYLTSEDTETDFTNEFTTDPESTVEDTDDSHTRKSNRSRKRPKILDL